MSKSVQKDFNVVYNNKAPSLMYDITDVSPVVKTWFNKKLPNASTVEEMLKRPTRYSFYITELIPKATSCKRHICYYDNEESAKEAHKKAVLAFYDQQTKPILKRIERNKTRLSLAEQEKIINIHNNFKPGC